MDPRKQPIPIFVEDSPKFEFRDGMFFSYITVGNTEFVCVYRPSTFIEANRRASAAMGGFFTGKHEPIKLAKG